MATITRFFSDTLASGSNHLEASITAPTLTARSATGWIVGTRTPPQYVRMDSRVERAVNQQGTTPQPDSGPNNTIGDCLRVDLTEAGTFAAGGWDLKFQVQGETATTSTHDGRLRIRVWKGTDPTGAGVTELTTTTLLTNAYADLTSLTAQACNATWAAPSITVAAGDYIFVQIAHELTGAGNATGSDTRLVLSSASHVLTTDFVPGTAPAPTGFTGWGIPI